MGSEKVELRPAWQWTCPECGHLNFEDAIVAEQTPEEMEQLRKAVEAADEDHPWVEAGAFMTHPEEVTCEKCEAEFEVDQDALGGDEEGG